MTSFKKGKEVWKKYGKLLEKFVLKIGWKHLVTNWVDNLV